VSGEVRILRDHGGVLGDIVDSLHDVTRQLRDVPHALVGGVAVLVHVQGHRVTEDIDSAVQGDVREARRRLLLVADPPGDRDALVVMPNGVPVDVLAASTRPPRVGIGHAREARAHAVRWAIDTADLMTVGTDPGSSRGPVTLPVARPSALVAMKTVSMADPKRGDKSATDLLDLWRLLSDDPIGTVAILHELRGAPERLRLWVQERITALFDEDPGGFVARMASAPGAARSVEDVRDLWDAVVGPTLA
jgi:hypothetical protein